MATRTVTKTIEQKRILKLSWKEIKRERRAYPYESFTVYALIQSDGEMLGYIINDVIKDVDYWCCYIGNQNYARTANLSVSGTLKKAQKKLMSLFADD